MPTTTDGKTAEAEEQTLLTPSEATEMLDRLDSAMSEGLYNATEGRVRSPESECIRAQWAEIAISAARERRKLLELIDLLDEAGYMDLDGER